LYRGALTLPVERGVNTFWGPDVIWHAGVYHMFVTFIRGVPDDPAWDTHGRPSPWHRRIHHLTSTNLWDWQHISRLDLGTDHAVDPYVFPLPDGGWGLWFKDESRGGSIWRAVSADLYEWHVADQALPDWHEGPSLFALGGDVWMLAESRNGLAAYRSLDALRWEPRGLLAVPGESARQPYVLPIDEDRASIAYYVQTGMDSFGHAVPTSGQASVIRIAELGLAGADLECRTGSSLELPAGPDAGERGSTGTLPTIHTA
jgi:hypothetical protein